LTAFSIWSVIMAKSDMNGVTSSRASRDERYKAGRALRAGVPRESHADCRLPPGRDPVAVLHATDAERIPELLPERYKRMMISPFLFLRGAAVVMAQDLSSQPMAGIPVQACGDCHLMNFGAFNTPEGRVLFDINDFDETLPAVDFTVDLKRLAASVAVAAIDGSMPDKKVRALAQATVKSYREFLLELAPLPPLEIWYTRMDIAREVKKIGDGKLREKIFSTLVKAKKDLAADDNFPHLATANGGTPRIEDRPPLIRHFDTESLKPYKIHAHSAFANYRATLLPERRRLAEHYELTDLALKIVGVGSVGTFCAIGLFMTADGDHLFLQVKQALNSVLEKCAASPKNLAHQGGRVVEGQRAMQAASDIFLGWTEDNETGRYFYVRQLKNRHLGSIGEVMEERALDAYASLCGRTLARAHAHTGDPALLAGYLGKSEVIDDALASFAMAYAAQTKQDHAQLKAAHRENTGIAAE
jgi:uncharacterized protein (DUF2252 family)